MTQSKALFTSRTFWGAVIAGLSGLLSIWGRSIPADDQAQLVDMAATIAAFVGSFLAIYGRVFADKKISGVISSESGNASNQGD